MIGNILKRVSYHAVYDDSIIDALRYASSNGFSGIQLACEVPQFSFDSQSKSQRRIVREFVQRNEVGITLHAPDETVSLFETVSSVATMPHERIHTRNLRTRNIRRWKRFPRRLSRKRD